MPKRGFLLSVSVHKEYVDSANYCANTIKDYYPEAHITLFIPQRLAQYVDKDAFDTIITDSVPDHTRTKLFALSRTPYTEMTVYVDADMECRHEDVATVWDQIDQDTDILITRIRPYNGKIAKWPQGEMIHHGGFFMYRTNPITIEFMRRWWDDYVKQRAEPWPYNHDEYPITLRPWDQFTFWKLLYKDKVPVRVDFFQDDARWNFVNGYYAHENKDPIIFYHNTVSLKGRK